MLVDFQAGNTTVLGFKFFSLLIAIILSIIAIFAYYCNKEKTKPSCEDNGPPTEHITNKANEELEETIALYKQLATNSKFNNMANNFIELIDDKIFVDSVSNLNFSKQYLRETPLGSIFLDKLHLPEDNYIPFFITYDTSAFSTFNELLYTESKINSEKIQLISYLLLQQNAINKYSTLWKEKYHTGKTDTESINEYICRCFETHIIDTSDYYGCALLSYYILELKNDIYSIFSNEILNIQLTINELKEKRQNELLRKQILSEAIKENMVENTTKITIDDIDIMPGSEFEFFICDLYKQMGYTAYVTKTSGDQGLDIIAEKNNKRIGIQAKCYANTVGNSAIQEAVAGKNYYSCDRVMVITNNFFTKSAITLAEANNVVLWNRNILKEKIKELF